MIIGTVPPLNSDGSESGDREHSEAERHHSGRGGGGAGFRSPITTRPRRRPRFSGPWMGYTPTTVVTSSWPKLGSR